MTKPIDTPLFSRRRLIAASVSGTLLGSSWAVAFRDVTNQDCTPSLTIARKESALAMLIEYRGRRIIVVDSADGTVLQELTELVTGFMKQRIDLLLATHAALAALPTTYRKRWQVQGVFALPDSHHHSGVSLDSQSIEIEGLEITADRLPFEEWRTASPPDVSHWYVSAAFKRSRLVLTSTIHLAPHLPWPDDAKLTCLVTNDEDVSAEVVSSHTSIIAAPAEASLFATGAAAPESTRVPLHRGLPMTFRLTHDGIALPPSF